jgi:shikimate kinase
MKIFLIGFMGVGKTTLGKMMASKLRLPFVDMDHWISQQQKLTISEIFGKYGEPFFRKLEFESLRDIIQSYEDVIIATGGGFPCHGQNMEIMNQLGTTIYFNTDAKPLAKRLAHAKTVRPLIAGKDEAQILEVIEELLSKREKFYQQAHHLVHLDVENTKLENLKIIFSKLEFVVAEGEEE